MAALGRRARRALDEKIRQALKIARVQEQQEGFFVGQHILAELRAKARQPLGDLGEARLLLRRKPRAGAREISMIAFEHARLFFIQAELFFIGLQRFDAGEQRFVEIGLAVMARQDRRHFALDRLQFVIARGAGEVEEDAGDLVEAAPAALQRLDGVGEARRRGIAGDGVDLRPRLSSARSRRPAGNASGFIARERRRLERPGPGREKGVLFLDEGCSNAAPMVATDTSHDGLFQRGSDGLHDAMRARIFAHDRRRAAASTSCTKIAAAPRPATIGRLIAGDGP